MDTSLPPFFRLPPELRLQIYAIVLDKHIPHHPYFFLCILSVCRQIREEAFPVLLSSTRYFASLQNLSEWTIHGRPERLECVKDISLRCYVEPLYTFTNSMNDITGRITEEDPLPHSTRWWEKKYAEETQKYVPPALDSSDLSSHSPAPHSTLSPLFQHAKTTYSKPKTTLPGCKSAVACTWEAMTSMPNIRRVWLTLSRRHTRYSDPRTFDVEQSLILSMISAAWPFLHQLTFVANLVPLDFLSNFRSLRSLCWTGYSLSTPAETLEILNGMDTLEEMSLYRYSDIYKNEYNVTTALLEDHISLTPEVLSQLRPLKAFEIAHMALRAPSSHLTAPMLGALAMRHKHSLRKLRLSSDRLVEGPVMEELVSFVEEANLKSLQLSLTVPTAFKTLGKRWNCVDGLGRGKDWEIRLSFDELVLSTSRS